MMPGTVYLSRTGVVAQVRQGSDRPFTRRTFDLMLDQRQPEAKQLGEAKRILAQIGYETRGVAFEPNPGS